MSFFDNLMAAYSFENGGNLGLDSFGGNNLTNNNAATQVSGKVGSAVHFDGSDVSNQSLSIPSNSNLQLANTSWELTCWVNFSFLPGAGFFPEIIGKWGGGGLDYILFWNGSASNIQGAATSDGSTSVTCKTAGISTGTWYFLDLYFDYPGTTLYLNMNNAPAGTTPSASLSNTFAGTAKFTVGASDFGSPHLNGSVDSVGLWKRLLTTGERALLWNSGNGLEYPFSSGRRRVSSYLIR